MHVYFDVGQFEDKFCTSIDIVVIHKTLPAFRQILFNKTSLLFVFCFTFRYKSIKTFGYFVGLLFVNNNAIGFPHHLIYFWDTIIISIPIDFPILQVFVYQVIG